MNHPRGPRTSGKSKPESPALTLVHRISRYDHHHKKKRFFSEKQEGILSTNTTQHYHRTHTQDLRLFRCELSKVA